MTTRISKKENARFDTRLSIVQKQFFERAAILGGYRSLTDFVISTVQEKASLIVKEREQVLASQKDSEVFFDALMKPKKPNKILKEAVKDFDNLLSE